MTRKLSPAVLESNRKSRYNMAMTRRTVWRALGKMLVAEGIIDNKLAAVIDDRCTQEVDKYRTYTTKNPFA